MTTDPGPVAEAVGPDLSSFEERVVALPPDVILTTAACANWPSVMIGSLVVERADGWREAVARAGAVVETRRRLLEALEAVSWACPELYATQAAVDRVREWYRASRPAVTPDRIVRARYIGDSAIRSIMLRCFLEDIAAPAAHWLLDHVIYIGTGWDTDGQCIRCATPPGPVLRLAPICGASHDEARVRDLVLHESAHHLLLPDPEVPLPVDEVWNANGALLVRAATDPGLMEQITTEGRLLERQADGLARAWGAGVMHNDDLANDHTRREARALADVFGR